MVEHQPNTKNLSVHSQTGFNDRPVLNYFHILPGICSDGFRGKEMEIEADTGFKFSCYLITV